MTFFCCLGNFLNHPIHCRRYDSLHPLDDVRTERSQRLRLLRCRSMVRAKTTGIPSIRISTVTAASRLSMIKGNVVTFMIRLFETSMAQDTCFVSLAGPADPNNVVSLKGVLTNASGY